MHVWTVLRSHREGIGGDSSFRARNPKESNTRMSLNSL